MYILTLNFLPLLFKTKISFPHFLVVDFYIFIVSYSC